MFGSRVRAILIFCLFRGMEWVEVDDILHIVSCWSSCGPAVVVGPTLSTTSIVLPPSVGLVRLNGAALPRAAVVGARPMPWLGLKIAPALPRPGVGARHALPWPAAGSRPAPWPGVGGCVAPPWLGAGARLRQ
jgi:hypothetical protein